MIEQNLRFLEKSDTAGVNAFMMATVGYVLYYLLSVTQRQVVFQYETRKLYLELVQIFA